LALAALLVLVLGCAALSLMTGAIKLGLGESAAALFGMDGATERNTMIVWTIRFPRTLLALLVGMALGASGAVMQGLFRNPLADPGLVGVSSGASLAAVTAIVLGERLFDVRPQYLLPVAAFSGAFIAMSVLYAIATRGGRTSIATMLLAGIALAALTFAVTGLLIFISTDQQLRELTFWSLGSVAGASWEKVAILAVFTVPALVAWPVLASGLNAIALGEAAARHIGHDVQRLKFFSIVGVALLTGGAVAVSGGIAFVGVVAPHLLRLAIGADHRFVLPGSALLGGALLLSADTISRTIVSPAELPIGILTACLGAPFFLWMLLSRRDFIDA
jgi:iron complex transport system permease protein